MTITPIYANNPEKTGKPIFREIMTPVGKIVHCFHDKPQLQTTDTQPPRPVMDEDGVQKAEFKVTLAWPAAYMTAQLMEMRAMAATVVSDAWGPDALADPWLNLQPFLRDGNNPAHNTKNREYLHNMVYLNFKQKATPTKHGDGRITYSGKPGLVDEYGQDLLPTDLYAGCEARVSAIMFGTDYSGKRFVSTRLNNIQRAPVPPSGLWERMGGGGRPDAKAQFDPLKNPMAGVAPRTGMANLI